MTAKGILGNIKDGFLIGWICREKDIDDFNQLIVRINSKSIKINRFYRRNDVFEKGYSGQLECGFQIKLTPEIENAILDDQVSVMYFEKEIKISPNVKNELFERKVTNQNVKKLIFIHIPKTAGTSLRYSLYDNNLITIPSLKQISQNQGHYLKFEEVINQIQFLNSSKQVVFGHYPFSFFNNLDLSKFKLFTVVRDPIERSISNLIHLKSYNKTFSDMSLMEIIKHARRQVHNTQTRYLCTENVSIKDDVTIRHLDQALSNIYKFETIGTLDNLRAFSNQFLASAGVNINSTLKDKRLNKRKMNIDESELNEISEALRKLNELDLILYNRIIAVNSG